jgi:NhaA family Na+:H+ antiporter
MLMLGFRSFPLYLLAGGCIWLAVDASGIHATITGVMLGLMTPARRWVSDERLYAILDQVIAHPASSESSRDTKDRQTLQMAEVAARESLSPVERFEIALHPWVGFVIMPLFAVANAGLPLTFSELSSSVTVAIFSGFVLGKPIGILLFSWLAIRLHIAIRPSELTWRLLIGGSCLAGIGFTMALFIANIAFGNSLIGSAKLGIFLSSAFSAAAGITLLMTWLPTRGTTLEAGHE